MGRLLIYVAIPGGPAWCGWPRDWIRWTKMVNRAQQAVAGAALLALADRERAARSPPAVRSPGRLVEIGSAAHARCRRRSRPDFPIRAFPTSIGWSRRSGRCTASWPTASRICAGSSRSRPPWWSPWWRGSSPPTCAARIVTVNRRRSPDSGLRVSTDRFPTLPALFRVKAAREVVDAVLPGGAGAGPEVEMERPHPADERAAAAVGRGRAGAARSHRSYGGWSRCAATSWPMCRTSSRLRSRPSPGTPRPC